MTRSAIPALAALPFLLGTPHLAAAAPSPLALPDRCIHVAADGVTGRDGAGAAGLDAARLLLLLPDRPDLSLHAAHLHAVSHGAASVRAGDLGRASTAAAAVLLTALTGQRGTGCPDPVLQDAAAPLAAGLAPHASIDFVWDGVSLHDGEQRTSIHRLSLHLEGRGADAHLTVSADGSGTNDPIAALLPQSASASLSVPRAQLPQLLSAAGGDGQPVDVAIESLRARHDTSRLEADGEAQVSRSAADSQGRLHLRVHDFDALTQAAGDAGLTRARTALFLAKLVARHEGDASVWDLAWQGGTVTVNNVPLPTR